MSVLLQCLLLCHHIQMFHSNGIYVNNNRIRLLDFLISVKSRNLTLLTQVRILSEAHGLDLEAYKRAVATQMTSFVPSSARFQPKESG